MGQNDKPPVAQAQPWTDAPPAPGTQPTPFVGFRLEVSPAPATRLPGGPPVPGGPAEGGAEMKPQPGRVRRILMQFWGDRFWRDVPDIM